MPIAVRVVHSLEDKQAVHALRYEVYVAELERVQRYADHARRVIEEPLDAHGKLFVGEEQGRLVGTVRTNYARDGELGEYESIYQLDRLSELERAATSITTKLLVAPSHRNTSLAYRLAAAVYVEALASRILFDFIDVYPARVPFFERLGYRVHVPETLHPEYGRVVVMLLATRDAAHLRRVGSPFLRHLQMPFVNELQPCGELHGSVS